MITLKADNKEESMKSINVESLFIPFEYTTQQHTFHESIQHPGVGLEESDICKSTICNDLGFPPTDCFLCDEDINLVLDCFDEIW